MKTRSVPSSWLHRDDRRFDAGPYTSGALEAKVRLGELNIEKNRLREVTLGGMAGLVNPGRIKRLWVTDPSYGKPFLSSTDILQADLSAIRYISNRAVEENPRLLIKRGSTLITRAGTIGRMCYVRPDMDSMACTEDVLRVIPDEAKIPSGYLFAFLSSRFGVALVTSGTYGAIIQHIEPEHIADVPVPRLGDDVEQRVHGMVEEAAKLRTDSMRVLRAAGARFDELIADVDITGNSPRISSVPASKVQARLDAEFHDPIVQNIRAALSLGNHASLGDLCPTVFLPGIFKRIHVEDESFGALYYTGASLYWLEPHPKGILSRRTSLFRDVRLERGTVLVQAFGQEGGLTGRPVWVGENLHGSTTTHMLVRLRALSIEWTAYLFAFLQSEAAYRQIAVLTYGGSIPHFDESGIRSVVVPLLDDAAIADVSSRVLAALANQDRALALDRAARCIVERAIEKAS